MMTRGKLQEKEGKSRKYYCEPGSDYLSLIEEELSLQEPLPKSYAGGEEVENDRDHSDVRTPKTSCTGEKLRLVLLPAVVGTSNQQSKRNQRRRRGSGSN